MKTLLILSGVSLGGGRDVFPEDIVENVDDGFAASLVHRGKAVVVEPGTKAKAPGQGAKALKDMRATELLEYAASKGIDLGMKPQDGKEKILAALEEQLKERGLA